MSHPWQAQPSATRRSRTGASDPEQALAHLPPAQRGLLAPPSAERTRRIREMLARDLGREKPAT